jgi:hypothetical protein
MDTKELLDVYKTLFETWRFEVNSHWQRSSYFAAFETVAVAACWKLLIDQNYAWAGVILSIFGTALTEVWRRNNNKTHLYAVYWLGRVADLESTLSRSSGESINFASAILNRPRPYRIRHRHLVQAVPMIFFGAWIALLLFGLSRVSVFHFLATKIQHVGIGLDMASLIVSIASLLAAIAAVWIAKSSLAQARQVAEREQKEWKQRKWFDLYFKADEAYDALDHFRVKYPNSLSPDWGSAQWENDWNDLMRVMRTANRMAVVFPKNAATDALFGSTGAFSDPTEALSRDRLQQLLDAGEELRQKALVDPSVL